MPLKIDTSEKDFKMILKDYQEAALQYLWSLEGEGTSSRDIWEQVNENLRGEETISRASVINFLNVMVDDGVLDYTETTCKGGLRRIYSMRYNEAGFKEYVVWQVIGKLLRYFPEETRKAIK